MVQIPIWAEWPVYRSNPVLKKSQNDLKKLYIQVPTSHSVCRDIVDSPTVLKHSNKSTYDLFKASKYIVHWGEEWPAWRFISKIQLNHLSIVSDKKEKKINCPHSLYFGYKQRGENNPCELKY